MFVTYIPYQCDEGVENLCPCTGLKYLYNGNIIMLVISHLLVFFIFISYSL